MKLLALDQSTKITGYSVWQDDTLIISSHFDTEIKQNLPFKRMLKAKEIIRKLIEQYNPDCVVLEDCQYQSNLSTYKQLATLQGILVSLLSEYENITYFIVPPTTWKSYCGIKGKKRVEQKQDTVEKMSAKFQVELTEDEADSVGIGLYAIHHIKERERK